MSEICKVAPAGQFRVIGRDCPKDRGWLKNDYPTEQSAKAAVNSSERSFVRFQVFNDKGECVHGNAHWRVS